MINYYGILGVGFSASPSSIKSAYRKRARAVHPDAGHEGTRDFQLLQAAYQILGNPAQRPAYDHALLAWLERVGKVMCEVCGVVNQIPPIPFGFRANCGQCNAAIRITEEQRKAALRMALGKQVIGFVEDVGTELLAVARDAAVTGLERLRRQIGIPKRNRRS